MQWQEAGDLTAGGVRVEGDKLRVEHRGHLVRARARVRVRVRVRVMVMVRVRVKARARARVRDGVGARVRVRVRFTAQSRLATWREAPPG